MCKKISFAVVEHGWYCNCLLAAIQWFYWLSLDQLETLTVSSEVCVFLSQRVSFVSYLCHLSPKKTKIVWRMWERVHFCLYMLLHMQGKCAGVRACVRARARWSHTAIVEQCLIKGRSKEGNLAGCVETRGRREGGVKWRLWLGDDLGWLCALIGPAK